MYTIRLFIRTKNREALDNADPSQLDALQKINVMVFGMTHCH